MFLRVSGQSTANLFKAILIFIKIFIHFITDLLFHECAETRARARPSLPPDGSFPDFIIDRVIPGKFAF